MSWQMIRSKRIVLNELLPGVILLAICAGTVHAQDSPVSTSSGVTSDKVLSPPHRRVFFDSAPFSPGSIVPHWERGFLVSKNKEITYPEEWAVRLYDGSGTKVREISIWFPDSLRVFAGSAALAPDGRVVISGVAEKLDGTRAYYLALTDGAGKVTNVIQTNPYLATKTCVAPDGSVWTVGGSGNELKDDLTLRHFDFQKGELGAYLPRSSFNSRFSPFATRGDGAHISINCASDRVVIYTEVANEYIEVDYGTQSVHRWGIDRSGYDLPLMGGNGIAVTSSGDVYAVLGRNPMSPGLRGLFHLQRNPAAESVFWLPVEGQTGNTWDLGMINDVLGADGDALVYITKNDWPTMKWARPRNK